MEVIWSTSEQGSKEWLEDRCGVITASNFGDILDISTRGKSKGNYKAKASAYAKKLAFERISGKLFNVDEFTPWQARRGNELEPLARSKHENEKGLLVESVSLALTGDKKFGVSVDGSIDDDGISEYKCFNAPEKVYDIITKKPDFMDYVKPQIQGGLWITGREWCDFCLYCPQLDTAGLDFVSHRVYRDDEFIADMEIKLLEFDKHIENLIGELKSVIIESDK
jgi:exodeoxyribonuclease (lambda-induced)